MCLLEVLKREVSLGLLSFQLQANKDREKRYKNQQCRDSNRGPMVYRNLNYTTYTHMFTSTLQLYLPHMFTSTLQLYLPTCSQFHTLTMVVSNVCMSVVSVIQWVFIVPGSSVS